MKKFSDIKQSLDEATPQKKPQDNTAQKVNAAVSALGLRQQGIKNPTQVTSAVKKLRVSQEKNLSPSQQVQKLPTNQRNQYFQFGGEVPTGLLDPSVSTNTFRQVLQRLKATKKQITKASQDAEKMAAKAQQKANQQAAKQQQQAAKSQQQMQESIDQTSPPTMLVLQRRGIRTFPDGRSVAMYVNKQLGLVFSLPYVGKGQTPGEMVPGVQVTHLTNEEVEQLQEKIDKKQQLIDALDRHTELAVRANKVGDDEAVKVHQRYINKIKTKLGKLAATNEEVDDEDKGEYDYEGDMAISQLKSIITHSIRLKDMLEPDTNLPEWVQAKITLAEDYVVTAANYMEGQDDNKGAGDELDEALKHKIAAAGLAASMALSGGAHAEEPKTATTANPITTVTKTANDVSKAANSVGGAARSVGNAANSINRAKDAVGKLFKEDSIQEGSLKYHLDQAEKHNETENERLRDYHMNMAQHRVRGMRTPVEPNKKQQASYEAAIEQGKRFKQLRSQFNKSIHELHIEDPTLQDLHSKLNPKNKRVLSDLAKTNPRKALEIADKLAGNNNQQSQEQNTNLDK